MGLWRPKVCTHHILLLLLLFYPPYIPNMGFIFLFLLEFDLLIMNYYNDAYRAQGVLFSDCFPPRGDDPAHVYQRQVVCKQN